MGWNSGNEVFDPVAEMVRFTGIPDDAKRLILGTLIRVLQDLDWDTEDESLERFRDDPGIVEAFRRAGVPGDDDEDYEEFRGRW